MTDMGYLFVRDKKGKKYLRKQLSKTAVEIFRKLDGDFTIPYSTYNPQVRNLARLFGVGDETVFVRGKEMPKWQAFTTHVARATHITILLEHSSSPTLVQKAVGHADLSTTTGYNRQDQEMADDLIRKAFG